MVLDTPNVIPICWTLSPSLRKDLAISTFKSVIFRGVPRVLPLFRALSRPALVLLRMLSSSCCAAQVKKLARTSPITALGESMSASKYRVHCCSEKGRDLTRTWRPRRFLRVLTVFHPAPAYAVHHGDHQGVSRGQTGVQGPPALTAVGSRSAGDFHVPVYEVKWHASVAKLNDLSLRVTPRLAMGLASTGSDVTINPVHTLTIPFCATQLLVDQHP